MSKDLYCATKYKRIFFQITSQTRSKMPAIKFIWKVNSRIEGFNIYRRQIVTGTELKIWGGTTKSTQWECNCCENFRISWDTHFFINNTFISKARLKLVKNWAKAKRHPEARLSPFEIFLLSSCTLSSKNERRYKKCTRNKSICFNEIIWLMAMKMMLKMRSRYHKIWHK